jgi:hypothetical protein
MAHARMAGFLALLPAAPARRGPRPYIEMGHLTGEDGKPAALVAMGGLPWLAVAR